jgi:hypothetical protein
MEKRSHRRIRDLVAHTAFQGLDANEIGCVRISMMAGSKALHSKGRIQMRETNYLQIVTSGLHRTAGPYRCARKRHRRDDLLPNRLTWQRPCIPVARDRAAVILAPRPKRKP